MRHSIFCRIFRLKVTLSSTDEQVDGGRELTHKCESCNRILKVEIIKK